MLRKIVVGAALSGLLLAWGCGPKTPPRTVHESMTLVFDPQSQTIWKITNAAFNDVGDGLVASKISAEDWARLESAGQEMANEARLMARAKALVVAKPGVKLEGEGEGVGAPTAAHVQGFIDADPALFAERANALAASGDTVAKAAKARDVGPLFETASVLDGVCDSCHGRFWDPEGASPAKP